ncbi:unnamed protein product [Caenorhabditis auriculariae]|uniref:Uncharacterized protein n=1 Tax=Caenorhabditis auriculariae TaxID=2777116 RepID=A0A8S1HFG5_9PELO|nr:unnamed protein product [Caenorhabditis auriculariae]
MFSLTSGDYESYKGPLFRHFLGSVESSNKKGSKAPEAENDEARKKVQQKFIDNYFRRFIKSGGETNDHFDGTRVRRDELGIPQDLGRQNFVAVQREFHEIPSLEHVPPWLIRHFEYALRLSIDFSKRSEVQKDEGTSTSSARNQILIIAGDTGCGKSTQVPQYLLQAGYSAIACTQPRRIACTALARRVAYETLNAYGSDVAYQIRFETTKSKKTRMLFLTEGLLLRQMENDSLLEKYNVIILDEVHERHLTSDLLIGLLRDLVSKREDLKLILMSATINLELFSNYFDGAPVIQVPGRLYPIEVKWHPIKQFIEVSEKKSHKIDPEPYLRILELIDKQTPSTQRGDALIFLNGVAEITTVAETLKTYAEMTKGWIILMLHSTLSVEEQDKVFDISPAGVRKCILSTNIAETSVTIDGIRFVIDSGKVNLIKHEPGTGSQKLTEFWVSKASANQRKGRAGRTGPGTCYRLYSQEQFEKMEDFTASEINRVSLQEMSLRIISLNLALDPRTFPFIEKPSEDSLNEALEILKFQVFIKSLGAAVSKLPVDVPIAKMLVYGCVVDQLEVMLTVAAGLSVQSPFTNRSYRELDVVERRASLTSPLGDPFTLIAVFREWVMQKAFEGGTRKWTMENGIDEHRLYEISKLRAQYRQVLEDVGMIKKASASETGADDSRQRRIDQGERKKLFDLKRTARNSDKTKKVLSASKHFDTIMMEKEEEDLEAEADPLKADVKTIEFLLGHKQRDVDAIRSTHRLRRRDAEVIRTIITCGLYPNFSVLDPVNKYQHGQEMFVHTRMKPFTQIHPNSSIAQYHAESIDPRTDSEGRSAFHQIPFYGVLLETTKPYICNLVPVPALSLLLVAKKIVCDDSVTLLIDDFVEIKMRNSEECREIILDANEIRYDLARGLAAKLSGEEYSCRRLIRGIDKFCELLTDKGREISLKRLVSPPRQLVGCGIFMPEGRIDQHGDLDDILEATAEDVERREMEEALRKEQDDEDRKVLSLLAGDKMCPPTKEMVEEAEEKKQVPQVKESYYEKLLKRQQQKNAEQVEVVEKRVKTEHFEEEEEE